MLKNYCQTALRFLKQNKLFTGINLFGLSISLAASFIILLYVINELSYDHCHKNWRRIYRVNTYYNDLTKAMSGTPFVLANTLKNESPQIEKVANTKFIRDFFLKINDEYIRIPGAIGSSSEIFDIFSLHMIGDSKQDNQLDDLNSIVLSRKIAEKIFPGSDPVGKEITGLVNGKEKIFMVTGLFDDIPGNSTFRAQCFVNRRLTIDPINTIYHNDDAETNWNYDYWTTWILIKKKANTAELEKAFQAIEKKYFIENSRKNYRVQKLSNIYLYSRNIGNSGMQGNINNIKMLSALAFLILLVAAVNYIILSSAVSTHRAKEIGIRKTYGADEYNIRNQLLSESIILSIIVLPVAILFMWLGRPIAAQLIQTKLNILNNNILTYILLYLALTVLIGIASGLYTSYYLSRLKIMDILTNTFHYGKRRHIFRSGLIALQLLVFCTFFSSTLIIRSQYKYALNKDLGYYKNDVLFVHLGPQFKNYTAFIDKIKASPHIISVAGIMDELPLVSSPTYFYQNFADKEKNIAVSGLTVDYNLLKTMGMTLLKGRDFSREFGSDLTKGVIINEEAVKQLGIIEPIGKTLDTQTIIGVVKDFNLFSIHSDIPPLSIHLSENIIQDVAIHYEHASLNKLMPFLKDEWRKVAPDQTFEYNTIEEVISQIYSSEENLTNIVSIFAFLTLLISALGLFGLTLFVAQSRTKETGIKKIFGSSEQSIIISFLRENFILVSISTLISIPLTISLMMHWLSKFAYKVSINWWVFVLVYNCAVTIVFITVFYHSYKISRINPVDALRYQ